MSSALRDALKQEHDGLTDEIIDRVEELAQQHFMLDSETESDKIDALDQERERLIKEHIPRYGDVVERLGQH